ncbi:TPA: AarF/UbiB family protein [Vibrio diabolicus]|uniref:AarF/UbiB family protein n=1 Tax=Vibrio diabolicus TaxID=50719 RepID=UPI0038CD8BF6
MSQGSENQNNAINESVKWVFGIGVLFIITIIVISIYFPEPTDFQYLVFRIVLSIACAGFAAFLPGLLNINVKNFIKASGALAVLVLTYLYNPADLVVQPRKEQVAQATDYKRNAQVIMTSLNSQKRITELYTPPVIMDTPKFKKLVSEYSDGVKLYEAGEYEKAYLKLKPVYEGFLDYYLKYSNQ